MTGRGAGTLRLSKFIGHASTATIAVLIVLSGVGIAAAQQAPTPLERKTDLEIQKLQLEVARLKEERDAFPGWLTGMLGVMAGVVTTGTSVWLARRARLGELDQSVHDRRLALYPELVKATAGLALYFPHGDLPPAIGPEECGAMGRAMSEWYFGGGGLLLSVGARDAYFALARALTRASLAETLKVPVFPQDAEGISAKQIAAYQAALARTFNLDDVETWRFGDAGVGDETPAHRFKDFVFLQRLSSRLRTRLSDDLRSRRRPS